MSSRVCALFVLTALWAGCDQPIDVASTLQVAVGNGLAGTGRPDDKIVIRDGGVTNAMLATSSLTVSLDPDGGLTGGGTVELGKTVTLAIKPGGVTNEMLAGSVSNAKLLTPWVQVDPGAGLAGGGMVRLGETTSLQIADGGVTNAMLAGSIDNSKLLSSSVTVTAGAGLTGGGAASLGGSATSLSIADGGVTNSMLAGSIDSAKLSLPWVTVNTGSGLAGGGNVQLGGSLMLQNTGVLSVAGGGGINATTANGAVTLTSNAGGDLGGSLDNATVLKINGSLLGDLSGATGGQVLGFDQVTGKWLPKTPTFAGLTGSGTAGSLPVFTGANTLGSSPLSAIAGGDSVSLYTGHDAQFWIGSSFGGGQYGGLLWDDTNKSLRLWPESSGPQGGITIDGAGNVGIGTANPAANLDVQGHIYFQSLVSVRNGAALLLLADDNDTLLLLSSSRSEAKISAGYSAGAGVWTPINFYTENTPRITILPDGNVGIGTTAPTYPLHVKTSSPVLNPYIVSENDRGEATILYTGASGTAYVDAAVLESSRARAVLLNPGGGNVGIGTAAPAERLHVNGNMTVGEGQVILEGSGGVRCYFKVRREGQCGGGNEVLFHDGGPNADLCVSCD